jgi:hypothetical protein
MIKKIIISLVITASITALFTLVNIGHSVKSIDGNIGAKCTGDFFIGCNDVLPCNYRVSYNGFPIHDGQVNLPGDTWCSSVSDHTYSILGIIENLIIWFVIIFGLIEGYSLVRKSLSVTKTNQSVKK